MMRGAILSAFIAAAAATPAAAQDRLMLNNGDVVNLPACKDPQGHVVRYEMQRSGRQITMRGEDSAQWTILSIFTPLAGAKVLMHPSLLDLPRQTVQFVVEHECHHHEAGDVYDNFIETVMGTRTANPHDLEYAADCAAAVAVRDKYGYTADDLRVAFGPFPANDRSPTHPPTAQRVERAIACLNNPNP